MEWASVLKRVNAGEGQKTDLKQQVGSDLSSIGRAICAFANGEGGLIVLGVDDAGLSVGLSGDPHAMQTRLKSFLHSGCSAPVWSRFGCQEVANGFWIHWIEVPRIRGPEPLSYGGQVYIRRERSSVEPSSRELRELFSTCGFVLTEEQTIRWANSSDIDMSAFRSFLQAQGSDIQEGPPSSPEEDLRNAGVLAATNDALYPTLYGLMTFGKAPQHHLLMGNFAIRCSIYLGHDTSADVFLVDERQGRLEDQVRGATTWLSGLSRKNRPLIPETAIREALVNAVIHRDYAIAESPVLLDVFEDRVSVTSPGALPSRMTIESVQAGSRLRSRNESMALAMLNAGLMEHRGRGWPIMQHSMLDFNNTEPELVNDTDGRIVRVTFRLKP